MKSIFAPGLILLVATSSACGVTLNGGDDVRQVGAYAGVTNRSDATVLLVKDRAGDGMSSGDIQIACTGDIVADVDTQVDGDGNLVITMAAEVASIFDCEVRVIVDGIERITGDGDGDVRCDDPLTGVAHIEVKGNGSVDLASVEAEELDIQVTGTGSVEIDRVTVDTLRIDLRGTGDATLGGDAVAADLTIAGAGSLAGKELTVSETLDALLTGTGSAEITVLGTVNAEVHGTAVLDVHGGAAAGEIVEADGGQVNFH